MAVKTKPDATEASIKKELSPIQKNIDWIHSCSLLIRGIRPPDHTHRGQHESSEEWLVEQDQKQVAKEMTIVREMGSLGGLGVALNMFPITANATKNHLTSTESFVKKWVAEPDRWASYQVKVTSISSKLDGKEKSPQNDVECAFVCEALQKTADGEVKNKLSTTIPSTHHDKQAKETTNSFKTPGAP